MISLEQRHTIHVLHSKGVGTRKIAAMLGCDRKTIKRVIEKKEEVPKVRKDKLVIDEEVLLQVFGRCRGQRERVHEILTQEYNKKIGYSTLTALIREKRLGTKEKERSDQVPDVPGEEFQHDTSPYVLEVGGKKIKVQASAVYYRYSKVRYLKFYLSFTRFHMKCFFYEALSYWGYAPKECIIDNTNLAVLRGTGNDAVFVPEMIMFAKQYGFTWKAHALKHSDRKAGVERGFWFVEENFFPGRSFSSLEDLNAQAILWIEDKSKKPTTKKKIIPIDAFNFEKPYMSIVHQGLLGPYRQHRRTVDQYGYIAFYANYFWVPYGLKSKDVLVLEFAKNIRIYDEKKKFIEYNLPQEHIRNERFLPEGVQLQRKPNSLSKPSSKNEEWLRTNLPDIKEYLDEGIRINSRPTLRHNFVTGLYSLAQKLSPDLFKETVSRGKRFKVYDLQTLEKIFVLLVRNENYEMPEEDYFIDYDQRPEYLEGAESTPPGPEFYNTKQRGINEDT